jgi:hypothetical protein
LAPPARSKCRSNCRRCYEKDGDEHHFSRSKSWHGFLAVVSRRVVEIGAWFLVGFSILGGWGVLGCWSG